MDFLGKNIATNIKPKKEIKTNAQHPVDTEHNLAGREEGRTHNKNKRTRTGITRYVKKFSRDIPFETSVHLIKNSLIERQRLTFGLLPGGRDVGAMAVVINQYQLWADRF